MNNRISMVLDIYNASATDNGNDYKTVIDALKGGDLKCMNFAVEFVSRIYTDVSSNAMTRVKFDYILSIDPDDCMTVDSLSYEIDWFTTLVKKALDLDPDSIDWVYFRP